MKKKIFISIFLSSAAAVLLSAVLIVIALYGDFVDERKLSLKSEALYISEAIKAEGEGYLESIGPLNKDRMTLVAPDGKVKYDNFADASTLENHLNRPEIADAVKNGSGESMRVSDTIGERTYYYALKLDDGDILRVSVTNRSIIGMIGNTIIVLLFIIILAWVASAVVAGLLTKAIVSPILKLDLDNPLSNDTYGELSPLLVKLNKQNIKIDEQINELKVRQEEFKFITNNMEEALLVFGGNKKLLAMNKSAGKLFGNDAAAGKSYLELCRDPVYMRSVEAAFEGKAYSEKMMRSGKIYQLTATPVKNEVKYAAVMLAVDITEKEQRDKMRREFSANVSHELKTPLTSIIGLSELVLNGIAKREDIPEFAEKIHLEAERLLLLIEDIIKLSKLDEEDLKKEFVAVDLLDQANSVFEQLQNRACSEGITVTVTGEHYLVNGIPGTIHEIIYNLCDNALKYNKPDGKVDIYVGKEKDRIVLRVKDTGIGIAPEHRERIFERFYRIDKSRSKETGGTGLGLSIVKHGAVIHGADISLESTPGEGSEITVSFPEYKKLNS